MRRKEMDNEVAKCLEILKKGGIILYPTDTVWGIGCDATNKDAVEKVKQLKKRSDNKSFIILLDEDIRLNKYVKEIPNIAWDLVEYSNKPLTIIYPEVINIAPNILSEDGSAGIRITNDPFCRELIRKFRNPIVSTSANISTKTSPKNYDDIDDYILSGVDYVVNLQQDKKDFFAPSTIFKLGHDGTIKIIRK